MPRPARLFLPNMPLHIVQRGHDRQPVFVQPKDCEYYIANLEEAKAKHGIRLFSYCLMTNHVHLLISPGENTAGVSDFMRMLAGRQTRYANKLENRTGTLWEGRFKASMVDTEAYLLTCYRYIDLNPVRAAMVAAPEDYRWSSYRHHAGLEKNELIDASDCYQALGEDGLARCRAYQRYVGRSIGDDELTKIRTALRRNQVTGDEAFKESIERRTGRRLSSRGRGRPAKSRK